MAEKLFLSVGAMKAGTTWLYHKLNKYPEIHFSFEKELHYFAHKFGIAKELLAIKRRRRKAENELNRIRKNASKQRIRHAEHWYTLYASDEINDEWFHRVMETKRNQDKYLADFSNLTCLISDQDWQILRQQYDPLKVIYIMRDPIKRLWSHYKFELQINNKQLSTNFADDFLLFQTTLSTERFIRNAHYSKVLSTLRNSLANEQLMVCYFEDMVADPVNFLSRVEDFLDISKKTYDKNQLLEKKNVSSNIPMPIEWRDYAFEVLKDEIKSLKYSGDWSSLWTSQ